MRRCSHIDRQTDVDTDTQAHVCERNDAKEGERSTKREGQ